jgi:serine phosphatase RsbU (regulator of sigma subunit)
MSPEGAARPSAKASSASIGQHNLDKLGASATPGHTQGHMFEVAGYVVEMAATQLSVEGARLWHLAGDEPRVCRESGVLPPPDPTMAAKAFANGLVAQSEGRWACSLDMDDKTFGVLELFGAQSMSAQAEHLLKVFAPFAAAALAGAELRHAAKEFSAIVEATKRLNSTLDLGELISIILQIATGLTGAERGTVFLVDRERKEIWSLVGLGLEHQEIRISIERGIAGWVARHGETVSLQDAYADPRFEPSVDRSLGYHTAGLLGLPIRNKDGNVVGVLELLNKKRGTFSEVDESSLSCLSDHVALALENAQLHRELLAKQRLESDLELARNVQRGLLPESSPRLAGFDIAAAYAPAQMIGGDYYDFLFLNPQLLLFVVADVEGKGVASALMMANLQAVLHALAAHQHSLEDIVRTVNDTILADTRTQKFLSMFVAVLDQRDGTMQYVNAGHVPPVVIHADGSHITYLNQGGTLVGLFPGTSYESGSFQLQPGDVVANYTDGISEAMDPCGNQYGVERLVDVVRRESLAPAQAVVEAVLS